MIPAPPSARRVRPGFLSALGAALLSLFAATFLYVRRPGLGRETPRENSGVDAGRLRAHVRALTALAPRDAEHPERLDAAARYIAAALRSAGGRVRDAEYSFEEFDRRNRKVRRGPYRNILAAFGPEEGERIVVGAHYDACGRTPGADDDASGVAVLLELARLLGRRPPSVRIELAAYTLEEPPYFGTPRMGSVQHARSLRAEGADVRAMLALEMLGCYSDAPGSQRGPSPLFRLLYPDRGDFVALVSNHRSRALVDPVKRAMRGFGLPVYSVSMPGVFPGIDYSDHASFWEAGYPALMLTDGAFYRNRRYHTLEDTADTLDYRRMAMAGEAAFAALSSFR